jgi:hypothetical protein
LPAKIQAAIKYIESSVHIAGMVAINHAGISNPQPPGHQTGSRINPLSFKTAFLYISGDFVGIAQWLVGFLPAPVALTVLAGEHLEFESCTVLDSGR